VEQLLARTRDVPGDPFESARATSDAMAARAGR
jgi:hypothetical protein